MKKWKNKKILSLVIILIAMILISCSPSDNQDLKHLLIDQESAEVKAIKNMTMDGSNYKMGDLIDASLGSPTYELYDPAEDGNKYVTIQGKITYADVPVVATLQYKSVGEDRYEFHTLTFNEVPQNMLVTAQFFEFLESNYEEKQSAEKYSEEENTLAESEEMGTDEENGSENQIDLSENAEYILLEPDNQFIEREELEKIAKYGGKEMVRRAVNEIYARHGFVFNNEKNKKYFESKSWYYPKEGITDLYIKENLLNEVELTNLNRLIALEKRLEHPERGQRRYGSIVEYVSAHPERYSGDWGNIDTDGIDRLLDAMLEELEGYISEEELYAEFMKGNFNTYHDFVLQFAGHLTEPVIHSLNAYAFEIEE